MSIKQSFSSNLKNIPGWRTRRRIIVFAVDDYGNVRIDSKDARKRILKAGVQLNGRFDAFDSLETRQDLEMLYDVLGSVKDKNGRHAVFTSYAVPCNLDFEKIAESGYSEFYNESLTVTFDKLSELQPEAYNGAWKLWQQGMYEGFMVPQFHGREHLNLKVFRELLEKKDPKVLIPLKNRSYSGFSGSGYSTISNTAAFDFWEFDENKQFGEIIREGTREFEEVFGYSAVNFTPPAYNIHSSHEKVLKECGIRYIDTALLKKEHLGLGKYRRVFNYTGKRSKADQIFLVRNVVFEPTEQRNIDWVSTTMSQIEAAFRWNRPAIISSHRVNFCGHIDPDNREKGLRALRELLHRITERWPDAEFVAANELGDAIREGK
ncbi:hypothetical protein [Rhodohalobacter mucosus]|uniref:hypothetical protein n=1 Tax=Rhodohalobacter mucosus TaxID=2079485 RepID=UPI0018EE9A3E|nr:hypothetical protein [Rhodohalobacter mucosus]